jgi:hypothetical protein
LGYPALLSTPYPYPTTLLSLLTFLPHRDEKIASFLLFTWCPRQYLTVFGTLVEEQPGTPGNFPGLFKVAREKYLISPAQISGQNDKNFGRMEQSRPRLTDTLN